MRPVSAVCIWKASQGTARARRGFPAHCRSGVESSSQSVQPAARDGNQGATLGKAGREALPSSWRWEEVAATLFEKGPPPSTELLSQCCSAVSQAQGRPRGWVCEACSPGAWHLRVPASPSLPAAGSAAGSGGTNCSGEESSCDRWGEGNVV